MVPRTCAPDFDLRLKLGDLKRPRSYQNDPCRSTNLFSGYRPGKCRSFSAGMGVPRVPEFLLRVSRLRQSRRCSGTPCDEAHKCLKKRGLTGCLFWLESAAEKAKTSTWSHPRTQELESRTRNRIVTHPYQPGRNRVAPRFCKARLVCILGEKVPRNWAEALCGSA